MRSTQNLLLFSILLLGCNTTKVQNLDALTFSPVYITLSADSLQSGAPDFELSNFITLGQYKRYLNVLKQDTTITYYQQQLPDSMMCLPTCFHEYMSNAAYDDHPVVGVSWDSAMRYCNWKMEQDNDKDGKKFIYRLPSCSEWNVAATSNRPPPDIDTHYADWTLNTKDESFLAEDHQHFEAYYYFALPNDPPVMKRKVVLGQSFLRAHGDPIDYLNFSYYAFEGYRHVSFRLLREYLKNDPKQMTQETQLVLELWRSGQDQ